MVKIKEYVDIVMQYAQKGGLFLKKTFKTAKKYLRMAMYKGRIFLVRTKALIKKRWIKMSTSGQTAFLSFCCVISLIALVQVPKLFDKQKFFPTINASDSFATGVGEEINLIAVGDIMVHDGQLSDALSEDGIYDFTECFSEIRDAVSSADISLFNLDGVISNEEQGYCGYPYFFMPESMAEAVDYAGFDIAAINNENIYNAGSKGVTQTRSELSRNSIKSFGAGNQTDPLIINQEGVKIAFVSGMDKAFFDEAKDKEVNINQLSRSQIRNEIVKCTSKKADIIVVCLRWGEEGNSIPSEEMRDMAHYLVSLGADIIIGSGSHVAMPTEIIETDDAFDFNKRNKGYVFYSLGNFISNQRNNSGDIGAMVNIKIRKISSDTTRVIDYGIIPTYTNVDISDGKNFKVVPAYKNAAAPSWMDSANEERFYKAYNIISTLTSEISD